MKVLLAIEAFKFPVYGYGFWVGNENPIELGPAPYYVTVEPRLLPPFTYNFND